MARGNAAALGLGPGYLYVAPIGTPEPTDLATAWASISAAWVTPGYCVDIETEILTRRGWLRHDQVEDGDECLGLSSADGLARWQPILKMNRFPAPPQGREMIHMASRFHDSLTTPNHRWLVDRRPTDPPHLVTGRCGRKTGWTFTTTETMLQADHIPVAAPVVNLPAEAKYEDALVEAVAWFVTEGSIHSRNYGAVAIYQSLTANPQHCASIRKTLTALFGPARDSLLTAQPGKAQRRRVTEPAWREGRQSGYCATFNLNKAASAVLTDVAPGKIICPEFVAALTEAQLHLLIDTAIKGDGWHGHFLSQRDASRLDAFQMAASLLGRFGTLNDIPNNGRPNWVLNIIPGKTDIPARRRMRRLHLNYRDLIWCPTTPTGTWLGRRNGKVFYSGNTEDGSELSYNPSTSPVDVAEELDHLQVVTTGRDSTVKFNMTQITAANLKIAFNGGVLTAGTGIVTFEPPDLGTEVRCMLGFESEDHTERWCFRQCFQTGTITLGRHKGANNASIAAEFSLEKPATGLKLFKAIMQTPLRQ